MAERDPRASIITNALKPVLDWATTRLYANRGEHLHWQRLRPTSGKLVIDALHDAGYTIVPLKRPEPAPSITSKGVTPYETEIRAEVPIEGTAWTTHAVDARFLTDADFLGQHLPRRLARELLVPIEEKLAEECARLLATAELEVMQP